jgi:hypothetical protein
LEFLRLIGYLLPLFAKNTGTFDSFPLPQESYAIRVGKAPESKIEAALVPRRRRL